MVCVPCLIIPVLIWLFRQFVQPWLSKFWSKPEQMVTEVQANLVCPMPKRKKKTVVSTDDATSKEGEGLISGDIDDEAKDKEDGLLKSHADMGQRIKAE